MLAGQFAVAAVVKGRAPQLPLWSLMLSTQLLGILFVVLDLLGIESYGNAPQTSGGYGSYVMTADYSHSLVGALGISVLGTIIVTFFWGSRNGLIIGGLTFSHWLFDLLLHRSDLAVLPWNPGALPRLGFGLWSVPALSIGLELILILGGAFIYYHAAMRSAVRAERQDAKAGVAAANYRQRALVASIVMLVCLVATLVADVVGVP